jgi:DnaJ-class molecular chaperone
MSEGPELPGPSTCDRCGKPASSAPIDLVDGTRFYCPRCLMAISAPCPMCAGLGRVRQLDDDDAHTCPACYGTGLALEQTR